MKLFNVHIIKHKRYRGRINNDLSMPIDETLYEKKHLYADSIKEIVNKFGGSVIKYIKDSKEYNIEDKDFDKYILEKENPVLVSLDTIKHTIGSYWIIIEEAVVKNVKEISLDFINMEIKVLDNKTITSLK